MCKKMQRPKEVIKKQKCKAFCCSCRLSLSSSEEAESSDNNSDKFRTISSISHAMVQERLDQMIREREKTVTINEGRVRRTRGEETKFVVVVAMEKSSYDPRKDFKVSMVEMIVANGIREAKDLRRLLNYYVTMNSEEFRGEPVMNTIDGIARGAIAELSRSR
ncbi:hypothetical protein BUALT_Bualt18G0098300 [Buddleja alternifolia]|uniref:Transcription repressor n=1 Tax=Buddleja alternifolia TaxID=168488 RepID=A0AAV6W4V2_9LAMI|nr:hypothetical protein BUALT_Bualt18G0098300 [Buddleja alternifolia]